MAKKAKAAPPKKQKDASERYLLTYADMITLLMVFFIILYSMSSPSASKFQEASTAFASALNGGPFVIFQSATAGGAGVLTGLSPGQQVKSNRGGKNQGAGGSSMLRSQAVSTLQNLIKSGKVRVIPTENGFAISLIGDLYFSSASATINTDAMPLLQEVADFLGAIPNSIIVEGYTDSIPPDSGKWPSNWDLSSARSSAVLQTLQDYGIPAERISGAYYGDTRPVQSNDTAEGRAYNRRVDIVIVENF
jgi:chemotaxis protein MotB